MSGGLGRLERDAERVAPGRDSIDEGGRRHGVRGGLLHGRHALACPHCGVGSVERDAPWPDRDRPEVDAVLLRRRAVAPPPVADVAAGGRRGTAADVVRGRQAQVLALGEVLVPAGPHVDVGGVGAEHHLPPAARAGGARQGRGAEQRHEHEGGQQLQPGGRHAGGPRGGAARRPTVRPGGKGGQGGRHGAAAGGPGGSPAPGAGGSRATTDRPPPSGARRPGLPLSNSNCPPGRCRELFDTGGGLMGSARPLRRADLRLAKGRNDGMLGRNGVGKTTLISRGSPPATSPGVPGAPFFWFGFFDH